ncbi:DUF1707 domain-containing protein [Kribbella sp. NPDC023855]|uniref:DUF1707 SHOCT-like domain-containing protein n=1 Tax=Kribbella sp. NPDC023855 TaxID=3154698 RepID=UPI0033E34E87
MNEEKPVRIGDREREEAVARLGAHYEAGRLTAEEHQERVGEALQAKTQLDLAALFEDLPREQAAGTGHAGGQARAGAQASAGGGRAQYGAAWMRGGRVPVSLVVLLGVVGVLASVACVVLGGHPPVVPFLLIVAGVMIAKSRRQGVRA